MAVFLNSLFGGKWITEISPAGFYTVQHPQDWKVAREGNVVNLSTRDGEGAATISAFHSAKGDMEAFRKITRKMFSDYDPIRPLTAIQKEETQGLDGEFRKTEDGTTRHWLVRAMHGKKVFVLITVNDSETKYGTRKDTYMRIVESLKIIDPNQ